MQIERLVQMIFYIVNHGQVKLAPFLGTRWNLNGLMLIFHIGEVRKKKKLKFLIYNTLYSINM